MYLSVEFNVFVILQNFVAYRPTLSLSEKHIRKEKINLPPFSYRPFIIMIQFYPINFESSWILEF